MREFKFLSDNDTFEYATNQYASWSNEIRIGLPHIDVWISVMTLHDEEVMCDIISHEVTRYCDMFENEETWHETLETFIDSLNHQFVAVEVKRLVHH